jgi:hypothetical protein
MKSRRLTRIIALTLFSALALPVQLGAQNHHARKYKHHHYKVVQMGTFGGPTSSIDHPGTPPSVPFNKIINGSGAVLGSGDTLIPDPNCFDGCMVNYAFRWQNGVQTNLGVLPQNPALGPQTPCFDCAWSVFAYSIAEDGSVAGQSLDNALDPLTGLPAGWPFCGRVARS